MSDSKEMGLLSPEEVQRGKQVADRVLAGLNTAILGQGHLTRLMVTALLARGHVLLEGLPGLGKTELVKAMSKLLDLKFTRLQFTPDLLPGDVTGGHILEEGAEGRKLVFHEGPIFTNLLLADEINRASPKTQSALLEAMQEQHVTVIGETRHLDVPFCVLATQNPIELEGTYPLPEAQLDRFLFKLNVERLDRKTLETILTERRGGKPPELKAVTDKPGLLDLFGVVDRVFLPSAVVAYIARLVDSTHPDSDLAPESVKQYVRFGASPRAAIAIAESARAHALLAGKPGVGFEDVHAVASCAMAHRLVLDFSARLDGMDGPAVVADVLKSVGELEEALPREVGDVVA
jgi:MoxR-like ATPase